jgi:hypothetical protein
MLVLPRVLPRRHVRHRVVMRAQVVRERDFQLVSDRIVDLSDGGMMVAAKSRVLTGEPVVLSFRIPWLDRWIDAEAVVTRIVHGRRKGDPGHALGLTWERIDDRSLRFLKMHTAGPARSPPDPPAPRAPLLIRHQGF